MLTNFISEAANAISRPVAGAGQGPNVLSEGDRPVIQRNARAATARQGSNTDIYERARNIYYRSRAQYHARPASIL